jgi:hypothetical protein
MSVARYIFGNSVNSGKQFHANSSFIKDRGALKGTEASAHNNVCEDNATKTPGATEEATRWHSCHALLMRPFRRCSLWRAHESDTHTH